MPAASCLSKLRRVKKRNDAGIISNTDHVPRTPGVRGPPILTPHLPKYPNDTLNRERHP
ncbi:hypothetical protein BDY21DRAFT_358283 [Lineolata rhizophorae]|uniref:Uncharacterized protein n=1 Tax=Lineolata rhizophorae TaxID=578093 RepID=A0A6A6NM52_9PEZI|nr:hypothetical protein BDY21DRAFT_358283 [Lineolata rhizophorae]